MGNDITTIKPKPLDTNNNLNVTKQELRNMVNLKGVNSITLLIKEVVKIANEIIGATAPDSPGGTKIQPTELLSLLPELMKAPSLLSAIKEVPAEFMDEITDEEISAISVEVVSLGYFVEHGIASRFVIKIMAWLNEGKNIFQEFAPQFKAVKE